MKESRCSSNLFQCNENVDEDLFPGWQFRPVNPVIKQEVDDFEPWNTTLPPCGEIFVNELDKMPDCIVIQNNLIFFHLYTYGSRT